MSIPHEFDRHFIHWLERRNSVIYLSSYKTNMVIAIGLAHKKEGTPIVSMWYQNLSRPMGIGIYKEKKHNEIMWIGTALSLMRYVNQGVVDSNSQELSDFDISFMPRETRVINDIDVHDLCVAPDQVYFVSPMFSSVCTISETKSFKVVWTPPWITKVCAEDRCHLNGMCLRDGKPRYVTCCSRTDIPGGWREHRRMGGVVYDIVEDRILCKGLSMPHSPRYHNGKLWVLESGEGYLSQVNFDVTLEDGTHPVHRVSFIPAFLRGLDFIGKDWAIVGGSMDRHENTFSGLPLGDKLSQQGVEARCGVFVVDIKAEAVVHNINFSHPLVEIYDVVTVEGYSRPHIESIDDSILTKHSIERG